MKMFRRGGGGFIIFLKGFMFWKIHKHTPQIHAVFYKTPEKSDDW